MSLVSVIIPNYNHAPFLKQRIESVLNQTFQDFELIILDDNSTDNSREIIDSYKENIKITHVVFNEVNSGSTFIQWKKGIELAKGEYIWIAESDDFAETHFLELLVDKISQQNLSLAYCRTARLVENKSGLYNWGETIEPGIWNTDHIFKGSEFVNSFLKYRNIIPNASAVVFKKKYFTNIDKTLKMNYAGDWFIWITIAAKGDVAYIHKSLNYFRRHEASTNTIKSFKDEIRRIEEYFLCIKEACKITNSKFKPFDEKYNWIINQWLDRIKVFGIKKSLQPPYPLLFLIKFYYKLLTNKI